MITDERKLNEIQKKYLLGTGLVECIRLHADSENDIEGFGTIAIDGTTKETIFIKGKEYFFSNGRVYEKKEDF